MILQLRNAQDILEKQLEHLLNRVLDKAEKYKALPEAGRTHAQHAVPITLGYKFAIWADELGRDLERLQHDRKTYFAGNFGGAAGTLASLFDKGIAVRNDFCKNLGLAIPTITWHVSRDRLANFSSDIAIAASTIGKMANEIINLQRTEIEEVEEGFQMGKVARVRCHRSGIQWSVKILMPMFVWLKIMPTWVLKRWCKNMNATCPSGKQNGCIYQKCV